MKKLSPIALVVFVLIAGARSAHTGDTDALATKISWFAPQGGYEFGDLCHRARIPCGFEALAAPGPVIRKGITGRDQTVQTLLDKLVAGPLKDYIWRMNDGVAELLPRRADGQKSTSPLDTRIAAVDFENEYDWRAAEQICEKAGVARHTSHSFGGVTGHGKISVHLRDVTIREALDAIVRKDGQSMWVFYPYQKTHIIYLQSWRPYEPTVK